MLLQFQGTHAIRLDKRLHVGVAELDGVAENLIEGRDVALTLVIRTGCQGFQLGDEVG